MKNTPHFRMAKQLVVLAGFLAGTFGTAITAAAQDVSDLQTPKSPLVLKAQGSFFVGGDVINAAAGDLGAGRPAGQIVINQMYVEYMIPQGGGHKVPVVMIEGGGLSGKSWETTPDGRMGFDEYFVRQGHPVYDVDQVWRGRSGFDVAVFNQVRAGITSPNRATQHDSNQRRDRLDSLPLRPVRSAFHVQTSSFPSTTRPSFPSKGFRVSRSYRRARPTPIIRTCPI